MARPGAVEKLLDLGVVGFDVSFHSHLPRIYDRLTGTRGQHARAAAALARIFTSPCDRISVCVVINSLNYRSLPAWVGYIGRLVRYADDFSGAAGDIGRAKSIACRRCLYDGKCLGVPAEYARLFGVGALHAG